MTGVTKDNEQEFFDVKVICSSPRGFDFQQPENKKMMEQLASSRKLRLSFCETISLKNSFPECLRSDSATYDMIWFAGCNLVSNLFRQKEELVSNLDMLRSKLRRHGFVVFTETKIYKKTYAPHLEKEESKEDSEEDSKENSSLTISIEALLRHPMAFDNSREKFEHYFLAKFKERFQPLLRKNHITYVAEFQAQTRTRTKKNVNDGRNKEKKETTKEQQKKQKHGKELRRNSSKLNLSKLNNSPSISDSLLDELYLNFSKGLN